jgi:hypothetical protein
MTTSTIFKSDFKDFKGLHPAVMCMKACTRPQIYKNFIVIDNWSGRPFDRTPFDLIELYSRFKDEDEYNLVLEMAEVEGFDVLRVKHCMDTLQVSSQDFSRAISAAICYPQGHVNRRIFNE